jgi:hypothetical protein
VVFASLRLAAFGSSLHLPSKGSITTSLANMSIGKPAFVFRATAAI